MSEIDEIDIGAIFFKILSGIKNKLSRGVFVIKKRIILILVISTLGILSGGIFYKLAKPVYKTEMVLTSKTLSNDYCKYLITNLNENIDVFAQRLNVNSESIGQVAGIEYSKFDEKFKESKDSLSLGMPFKIKLRVFDPSVIDTLQTFVIKYLENNEYALKRKNVDIEYKKSLIKKLQAEQLDMDSLKNIETKNLLTGKVGSKESISGIILGNQVDPLVSYKEVFRLYREELILKNELLIPENINVIEGFTPQTTPSQPVLRFDLLAGLLLGFIVSFLIALFIEK